MIPYAELEKALARWKARMQGAEGMPSSVEAVGVPRDVGEASQRPEHSGEIALGDDAVESYEETH